MNWMTVIDELSGGDILKEEAIYQMNYLECLNKLSYWKYKHNENEQFKRTNKRN